MAVRTLPEVETRIEIAFARGAHIPKGVKAGALAAEIDTIAAQHGTAPIAVIKEEVLARPAAYPNITAWLPKDRDEAWDIAVNGRLQACVSSIVRYEIRITTRGEDRTEPVRLFHITNGGENGQRGYLRLEVIARDEQRVLELYDQLEAERAAFQKKERRVGSEIRALLSVK